jgi:AraC-like DNA-binding protein/quercetin dioxygenase-like cupin family protein
MRRPGAGGKAQGSGVGGGALDDVFASIACAVFGAGRYSFPPDWRLPPGSIDHYRLFIALRGAAGVAVGEEWHPLAAGGVILVPPHVPHQARNDPAAPLTAYVVDFEARLHGVLDVPAFCGLPVALTPGPVRGPKIAASAGTIVRHLTSLIPGYQLALHTHCVRLLDLLWKETLAQATPAPAPPAGPAPARSTTGAPTGAPGVSPGAPGGSRALDVARFEPAFRLVAARYAQRLTLADLAGAVHLHPTYFATLFRRATGEPPLRYVTRYRLQRARDLLLASDYPLGEIARRTGFYDAPHLSRAFSASEGVPPGHYRRQRAAPES